eukprot:COSAG01_NODE_1340_length_10648_cov_10.144089_5_plen_256_part_00
MEGRYANTAMNHYYPRVTGTATSKKDGDAFGSFNATGIPNSYEQPWHRQVLVLSEGPAVIVDRFVPTIEQDGWLSGPTWLLGAALSRQYDADPLQTVNVTALDTNKSAFFGTGFHSTIFQADKFAPRPLGTMDLVLKMDATGGMEGTQAYGATPGAYAQTCFPHGPDVPHCPDPDDGFTTVFAKQRLVQGRAAIFTSVLVPLRRQPGGIEEAQKLAHGIVIGQQGRGEVHVSLVARGGSRIEIRADDTWTVTRAG